MNLNETKLTNFSVYVFGDRSIDEPSTVASDLANNIALIYAKTIDTFYTRFRDSLTSVSAWNLFTSIEMATSASYPIPELAPSTGLTAKTGVSWISISGFSLTSGTGIIYCTYNNDTLLVIPTNTQVYSGQNASSSYVSTINAWYNGTALTLNFSSLEANTTYMFYVTARNNNLGPYYRLSKPYGVNYTTEITAATHASRLSIQLILCAILVLVNLIL